MIAEARSPQLRAFSVTTQGSPYAPESGIHVYSDLRINLHLSAAEDDAMARRFLRILETYAALADHSCGSVGGYLLEVHGERLHAFIPATRITEQSIGQVFAYASSLTQAVYAEIKPLAGDAWDGFAMAADFGPAVMIYSDYGGGSIVSLGNAANAPAKKLGQEPRVQSGHLALRRNIYSPARDGHANGEWVEINVLEPTADIARHVRLDLTERLVSLAANQLSALAEGRIITFAANDYFAHADRATIHDPLRVQGFCFRADLDGFTAQVEAAFRVGPDAILRLVIKFQRIMDVATAYGQFVQRPVIELPWSGDCANLLLLPRVGESYDAASEFLPASAGLRWHEMAAQPNTAGGYWRDLLGTLGWAVGVAGGDEDEGNNGILLVANISASERSFRVAAGWAARRSIDGYQADRVVAGDTIVPRVDCARLDTNLRTAFRELDSRFMRATVAALKDATSAKTRKLGVASTVSFPNIQRPVPAPRPYWNGDHH